MALIAIDSLNDLASNLEIFFKGLSECGLLSAYSVQLQAVAVDFAVQVKFRYLIFQFIKSLQNLLIKLPIVEGHEIPLHDVGTQTWSTPDVDTNEVKLPVAMSSRNSIATQLSSLVETCVFTPNEHTLNWEHKDSIQDEASCTTKSNAIGTTTEIIVECHPATLTINPQNFITSTATIATIPTIHNDNYMSTGEVKTEKCEVKSDCLTKRKYLNQVVSKESSRKVSCNKRVCSNVPNLSKNVGGSQEPADCATMRELKPFIIANLGNDGTEPAVESLDSYVENDDEGLTSQGPLNVMHIVVSSSEKQRITAVQPMYTCAICQKSFNSPSGIDIHSCTLRIKGQCDMCPSRFSTLQRLQEHCRTQHEGAGCFNCPICSRRFMFKLSYKRHMDSHGGKKGAVCDICGKMFSRTDYLQKHHMTHTGLRPFACSECPRKFISRSQLRVHEKIHSGIKEHVCDMCNKAFSRGDKLKDHMLRHFNIKPFQCSLCKKDYAEKRDLIKHLATHPS